ncbi:30S ribosomal protein S20 [Candidatus Gottesmanbacteria bacterium]|nr:30S ribosomal protein S20 [Candidatus Gottesmanbacteria bacterium]
MPITLSAKKKVRQDRKRTRVNARTVKAVHEAVKTMRQEPSAAHLVNAYSILDTAVKKHIINANRAARLKSRLAKLSGLKSVTATKPRRRKSPTSPKA